MAPRKLTAMWNMRFDHGPLSRTYSIAKEQREKVRWDGIAR
jgi:hypothetical protein